MQLHTAPGAILLIVGEDSSGRPLARLISETEDQAPGLQKALLAAGEGVYPLLREQFQEEDLLLQYWLPQNAPAPLPALPVGSLLAATDLRGVLGEGGSPDAVMLAGASVIGTAASVEMASEMVAAAIQPRLTWRLAGDWKVALDIRHQRAASEPDSALILAWDDGSGLQAHVVSHSGPYLHWATQDGTECHDLGIKPPGRPGVYTLLEARSWGYGPDITGECDSGLDGRLELATAADIAAFGHSEASLLEWLREMDGASLEVTSLEEALSDQGRGRALAFG